MSSNESFAAPTRLPPQNLEAEISVLGSVLLDNSALDKIADSLNAEDFYREGHRLIFETLLEMATAGTPADTVTLFDALKVNGRLDRVGGPEYLARLAETVPTPVNVEHYARIVRDRAVLRRFIAVSTGLLDEALHDVADVDDFVDRAEALVFGVGQKRGRSAPQVIRDLLKSTFAKLEERMRQKSAVTGVTTGFVDLDKMTAGMQPSDLLILAARPAMGKTALALNLVTNAALLGGAGVAIFSLEMSKEQLVTRMISAVGRVQSERIRTGYLGEDDFQELFRAADELSRTAIYIDDTPALPVMELRSKCRRLKAEDPKLGLIVVDYLQLMRGPANIHSREQEISEISRSLKALAKELNVPVIALSQLNRSLEARANRRPILSDLRESGAIEQDADLVMFIYRDEVYNEDTKDRGVAEVIIAKQRNGSVGTIRLAFQGAYTRFDNLAAGDAH